MTILPFLKHRDGFEILFLLAAIVVALGVALITRCIIVVPDSNDSQWMQGIVGWVVALYGMLSLLSIEHISRPPSNNVTSFQRRWKERQQHYQASQLNQTQPSPILVCIGDSITHGAGSANFVNRIRPSLFHSLAIPKLLQLPFDINDPLSDPLWVVNAGQNSICSWTIYHERLASILSCHADWILIMIGTNDVRAMYKKEYSKLYEYIWNLPKPPNWEDYRLHVDGMVQCLMNENASSSSSSSSPLVQIGLCTLPPMGEYLQHPANELVRKANVIIIDIAHQRGCKIVPVYAAFEEVIRHKQQERQSPNQRQRRPPPVEQLVTLATWMGPLHYLGCSWNRLSHLVGNHLLTDTLHLNEDAAEIVADLVVQWLVETKIQARLIKPTK